MMTQAEMFSKVVDGLITQGLEPAVNKDGGCEYRMEKDGKVLRCAAGQLMEDGVLTKEMEGQYVQVVYDNYNGYNEVTQYFIEKVGNDNLPLLKSMQEAHDDQLKCNGSKAWASRMLGIHAEYMIDCPETVSKLQGIVAGN